jgi:Sec-independent protein translocase protein TatA
MFMMVVVGTILFASPKKEMARFMRVAGDSLRKYARKVEDGAAAENEGASKKQSLLPGDTVETKASTAAQQPQSQSQSQSQSSSQPRSQPLAPRDPGQPEGLGAPTVDHDKPRGQGPQP